MTLSCVHYSNHVPIGIQELRLGVESSHFLIREREVGLYLKPVLGIQVHNILPEHLILRRVLLEAEHSEEVLLALCGDDDGSQSIVRRAVIFQLKGMRNIIINNLHQDVR